MRPLVIAPTNLAFRRIADELGLSVVGPQAAAELTTATRLEGVCVDEAVILVYDLPAMRGDAARMQALQRARNRQFRIYMVAQMPV